MASLDTLKAKKAQANKYLEEIEEILTETSQVKTSIQSLTEKVNSADKELRTKTTSLRRLERTSTEAIESFQKKRDELTLIFKTTNDFYNKKYLPLQKRIIDPTRGLNNSLANAQKNKTELRRISTYCDARYEEIKKSTVELKKQITQLRNIGRQIDSILRSSQKSKAGVDNILERVKQVENDAKTILKGVRSEHEKARAHNKDIENFKNESKKNQDAINKVKTDSIEKLKSIQDIYELANATGLSGEFEKRRNQHKTEKDNWRKWVFGMSISLLISLLGLYVCQLALNDWDLDSTLDASFYIRFVILSPIVYYLYFSSAQYNKERRFFDKYSFKATLALQLKQHIELLTNMEKLDRERDLDKVLDFIVIAFQKIYNEPFDDEYKMNLKLADIELNLEKKLLKKIGLQTKIDP